MSRWVANNLWRDLTFNIYKKGQDFSNIDENGRVSRIEIKQSEHGGYSVFVKLRHYDRDVTELLHLIEKIPFVYHKGINAIQIHTSRENRIYIEAFLEGINRFETIEPFFILSDIKKSLDLLRVNPSSPLTPQIIHKFNNGHFDFSLEQALLKHPTVYDAVIANAREVNWIAENTWAHLTQNLYKKGQTFTNVNEQRKISRLKIYEASDREYAVFVTLENYERDAQEFRHYLGTQSGVHDTGTGADNFKIYASPENIRLIEEFLDKLNEIEPFKPAIILQQIKATLQIPPKKTDEPIFFEISELLRERNGFNLALKRALEAQKNGFKDTLLFLAKTVLSMQDLGAFSETLEHITVPSILYEFANEIFVGQKYIDSIPQNRERVKLALRVLCRGGEDPACSELRARLFCQLCSANDQLTEVEIPIIPGNNPDFLITCADLIFAKNKKITELEQMRDQSKPSSDYKMTLFQR